MSEPVPGRTGCVRQVNVSKGGVPKLPVERAQVHRLGLGGDGHDEPEPIHGGVDQAVSLYCVEALARVAADGHAAFPRLPAERTSRSRESTGRRWPPAIGWRSATAASKSS